MSLLRLLPLFLGCFALAGCDFDEATFGTFQNIVIEERLDDNPTCGCGRSVYLANRSTGTARVKVRTYRKTYSGKHESDVTSERLISAGASQFLGCTAYKSPSAPAGSADCTYRSQYTILSREQASLWRHFRPRIVTVASRDPLPLVPVAAQAPAPNLPNCRAECSDPNSRNAVCIRLSETDIPVQSGLDWLAEALIAADAGDGVVAKSDIMARFEVDEDPCDRSDTRIAGGVLSNTGAACLLESRAQSPRGPLLSTVRMADTVTATVAREGAFTVARFDEEGRRTSVSFSDRLLQRGFGGEIYEIASGPEGVFATTGAGCLALLR